MLGELPVQVHVRALRLHQEHARQRGSGRSGGACAGQWADEHPESVAAYDAWRREHFPAPREQDEPADAVLEPAADSIAPADTVEAGVMEDADRISEETGPIPSVQNF